MDEIDRAIGRGPKNADTVEDGAQLYDLASMRPALVDPAELPPTAAIVEPGDEPPPGMMRARDVINNFSQFLATREANLLNAGMPKATMITMFIDHAAGILALYPNPVERSVELTRAIKQIQDFTKLKVARRRRAAVSGVRKGVSE